MKLSEITLPSTNEVTIMTSYLTPAGATTLIKNCERPVRTEDMFEVPSEATASNTLYLTTEHNPLAFLHPDEFQSQAEVLCGALPNLEVSEEIKTEVYATLARGYIPFIQPIEHSAGQSENN